MNINLVNLCLRPIQILIIIDSDNDKYIYDNCVCILTLTINIILITFNSLMNKGDRHWATLRWLTVVF